LLYVGIGANGILASTGASDGACADVGATPALARIARRKPILFFI
jgi:hypothetical protein